MDSQEQKYHLINQYLKGELKGRALDNFKALLKDPEFNEEVALQEKLVEAIEVVRTEELKAHFKDIPKIRYMQNEWGNKWTYASAAIVVLFISAFFVFKFYINPATSNVAVREEKADSLLKPVIPSDTIETRVDPELLVIEEAPAPSAIEIVSDDVVDEDIILDDTAVAASIEYEEDESSFEPAAADEAPQTTSARFSEADDELLDVKKDQFVASANFTVKVLSNKARADRAKQVDTTTADAAGAEDANTSYNTRAIKVEFWTSPVHFKGYQYQNFLKVYGFNQVDISGFTQLEDHLYLKSGGTYYFLKKNSDYNKFVPVTNSTLLKVLNE